MLSLTISDDEICKIESHTELRINLAFHDIFCIAVGSHSFPAHDPLFNSVNVLLDLQFSAVNSLSAVNQQDDIQNIQN